MYGQASVYICVHRHMSTHWCVQHVYTCLCAQACAYTLVCTVYVYMFVRTGMCLDIYVYICLCV